MELAGAFGLDDRAFVSYVGAGGKKTVMRRLVAEADRPVGYTTTTQMPPPPDLSLVLASPTSSSSVTASTNWPSPASGSRTLGVPR